VSHCHYCGEELYGDDQIDSGYCGLVCLERDEHPGLVIEYDGDYVEFDTLEEAAEEGRDYGFDYSWELER
jgi:hypothetical protein